MQRHHVHTEAAQKKRMHGHGTTAKQNQEGCLASARSLMLVSTSGAHRQQLAPVIPFRVVDLVRVQAHADALDAACGLFELLQAFRAVDKGVGPIRPAWMHPPHAEQPNGQMQKAAACKKECAVIDKQ